MKRGLFAAVCLCACVVVLIMANPVQAESSLMVDVSEDIILPGEVVHIYGTLQASTSSDQVIYIQIYGPDGDLMHQDLVDTVTDENGTFTKDWILSASAASGIWEVRASWSENVLISDVATFRVGHFTLDANVTGVFVGESVQFRGQLKSADCAEQTIYFQIFDANDELAYQRLSGIVTNDTGHFILDWTAPETSALGIWTAVAAWSADRSFNDTVEFRVAITDDIPPTIDGPPDVEFGELGTDNTVTWLPHDHFPRNYTIYRDGMPIKSGPWNSSTETISASAVGLPLGFYNYTIVVFDYGNNSASDTVMVTISDLTPPSVLDVADFAIAEGSLGIEIVWNGSDLHPHRFEIWLDDLLVKSGLWNSTAEFISFSLDGIEYGQHNLTAVFIDEGGNSGYDTVIVDVYDSTPPEIDPHPDVTFPYGELGHRIEWNVFDLNPHSYTILRNASLYRTGTWNSSSEDICVDLDNHRWGTWNYTLILEDIDSNSAVDDVIVRVEAFDETPPEVNRPSDIELAEGTLGLQIIWNGTDEFPMFYSISRNGTVIAEGLWNSSSELFVVSLDHLAYGVYNFTLTLADVNLNSVSDSVIVTVFDGTPPIISGPDDMMIAEGESGHRILWNISDLHPHRYSVFRNETEIYSADWHSFNETIMIILDDLKYGIYNFTLVAYDIDGNIAYDSVMVTVFDATPPTLEGPEDISIDETEQGQTLVWIAYDANPHSYEVFLNEVLIGTGPWNVSGEEIVVSVDGLILGEHEFKVVVYDADGNTASDTGIVFVYDWTNPVVSGPDDMTINEGDENAIIVWTADDLHPDSYKIIQNNVMIESGLWTSIQQEIVVSLTDLEPGLYNLTAVFIDTSNNEGKHTVIVLVQVSSTDTTSADTTETPTPEESSLNFILVIAIVAVISSSTLMGLLFLERKTGCISKYFKKISKILGTLGGNR